MWIAKTIALAALIFSLFVLSGHMATYVFSWTGCIWTSSVVFGVGILGSMVVVVFLTGLVDVFIHMIH